MISENPQRRIQPVFMSFGTFQSIIGSDSKLDELAKQFFAVWGGMDLTKDPGCVPLDCLCGARWSLSCFFFTTVGLVRN